MGTDRVQWPAVDATFKDAIREAGRGRHVNALDLLETARRDIDATISSTVVAARAGGATWREIGNALGVAVPTVWQKFSVLCLPLEHVGRGEPST